MNEPPPTTCVADDDPSVRRTVARLLKAAGFRALAYASAEEFLQQPLPDGPACLILDVNMPGQSGLDLQRTLAAQDAALPIVFLTGHGNIPMTVQAMKGGAVDFLSKPFANEALLAAIRQALDRGAQARQAAAETTALRQRAQALSPRERQVMALVVSGMLNKQAARLLGVTVQTIKAHRGQVMHKMGAHSLAALVCMAARLGITSPQSC
jgi:FixJ family two-component response regulator